MEISREKGKGIRFLNFFKKKFFDTGIKTRVF